MVNNPAIKRKSFGGQWGFSHVSHFGGCDEENTTMIERKRIKGRNSFIERK